MRHMNNEDYREILHEARRQADAAGLGAIDERIMLDMKGSAGVFWDLLYYLKHLREEIRLGSDIQYRETLRRVRQYVETESGVPVAGIKIKFSPEEIERYGVRELDFVPNRELSGIAEELDVLIAALRNDHERETENGDAHE